MYHILKELLYRSIQKYISLLYAEFQLIDSISIQMVNFLLFLFIKLNLNKMKINYNNYFNFPLILIHSNTN